MQKEKWHLFLDDIRDLNNIKFKSNWYEKKWIVARSMLEAINYIHQKGCFPTTISFDHDLGEDENGTISLSGYDFAKWLCENDMDGTFQFNESFEFKVHSDNPVGAENISKYINNYLRIKKL